MKKVLGLIGIVALAGILVGCGADVEAQNLKAEHSASEAGSAATKAENSASQAGAAAEKAQHNADAASDSARAANDAADRVEAAFRASVTK